MHLRFALRASHTYLWYVYFGGRAVPDRLSLKNAEIEIKEDFVALRIRTLEVYPQWYDHRVSEWILTQENPWLKTINFKNAYSDMKD